MRVLWDDRGMLTNAARDAARVVAITLLVLASGCRVPPGADPRDPVSPPLMAPMQTPTEPPHVTAWPVDPARTVVTIIVRRAGPLARLGHDHVITSADERGSVWMGATPAASAFELRLPVDRLEIDLPASRAAAGAEFATPVPDDARAGTRRNMLRPEVLDVVAHPEVTLRSIAATGDWSRPVIRVAVDLRGATRDLAVPVDIVREPGSVSARGELRINQSDFGITPFAVAGGAIQVADTLEVRFEITARAP